MKDDFCKNTNDLIGEDTKKPLCGTAEFEKAERFYITSNSVTPKANTSFTNLTSLNLSGNLLFNLRDLGTSLSNITELFVDHCQLKGLDGIINFPSLHHLHAGYNSLTDLSLCIYLKEMCYIDVEWNQIQDISSVETLALCPNLVSAVFLGNPFSLSSKYSISERMVIHTRNHEFEATDEKFDFFPSTAIYEENVHQLIPQLKYLDHDAKQFSSSLHCHLHPVCETGKKNYVLHQTRINGNSTSYLCESSQSIPLSKKVYCGVPGRAFMPRFLGTSNFFTDDDALRNSCGIRKISRKEPPNNA